MGIINQLTVSKDILIFAFRYSLGRDSSAPMTVAESIKLNVNKLSEGDLRLFIREIDECVYLGTETSQKFWSEVRGILKECLDDVLN